MEDADDEEEVAHMVDNANYWWMPGEPPAYDNSNCGDSLSVSPWMHYLI